MNQEILKLSAVRKVLETRLFLALGIIETLGSIISHGTSLKFADVRPHLRKVFKITLSSRSIHQTVDFLFPRYEDGSGTKDGKGPPS